MNSVRVFAKERYNYEDERMYFDIIEIFDDKIFAEQKLTESEILKEYKEKTKELKIKETPNSKTWTPMIMSSCYGKLDESDFYPTIGIYKYNMVMSPKNIKSAR